MNSILHVGMDVHTTDYTLCTYSIEEDKAFALTQVKPHDMNKKTQTRFFRYCRNQRNPSDVHPGAGGAGACSRRQGRAAPVRGVERIAGREACASPCDGSVIVPVLSCACKNETTHPAG